MKSVKISGASLFDETFSNENGHWNVTRANADCDDGLHGQPYLFDTEPAWLANKAVEYDERKLETLTQEQIERPLVLVIINEQAYLIDGRHRLELFHRAECPHFLAWVIEAEYEPLYRVTMELIGDGAH